MRERQVVSERTRKRDRGRDPYLQVSPSGGTRQKFCVLDNDSSLVSAHIWLHHYNNNTGSSDCDQAAKRNTQHRHTKHLLLPLSLLSVCFCVCVCVCLCEKGMHLGVCVK